MIRIIDNSGTHTKCILDSFDTELEKLEGAAFDRDWDRELAISLLGRCGLRADEGNYPTESLLRWSSSEGCWLREVRGKDKSGGEGKTRDVWVPHKLANNILKIASERKRNPDESLVSVSTSSVRRWVSVVCKFVNF